MEENQWWVFCRTEDWIARYGPFGSEELCERLVLVLAARSDVYGCEYRLCDGTIPKLPGDSV